MSIVVKEINCSSSCFRCFLIFEACLGKRCAVFSANAALRAPSVANAGRDNY